MERITSNIILTGNKKHYTSNTLANIPESPNDEYIITKKNDRLDLLANKYYNDATMWYIIALANNITPITFFIEPGSSIRIPFD